MRSRNLFDINWIIFSMNVPNTQAHIDIDFLPFTRKQCVPISNRNWIFSCDETNANHLDLWCKFYRKLFVGAFPQNHFAERTKQLNHKNKNNIIHLVRVNFIILWRIRIDSLRLTVNQTDLYIRILLWVLFFLQL